MNYIVVGFMLSISLVACNDRRQEPEAVGDLTRYSILELRALLDDKKTTSVDLVGQLFDKADELKSLNAYIYADRERALILAAAADATRATGSIDKPLLGIPIVVKDNIHVAGMPNTAGTPALKGFTPSVSNGVVNRLQAAGAIVIAVATPFTVAGLHSSQVLEHAWVVHDPERLLEVVKERIAEHNRTVHTN